MNNRKRDRKAAEKHGRPVADLKHHWRRATRFERAEFLNWITSAAAQNENPVASSGELSIERERNKRSARATGEPSIGTQRDRTPARLGELDDQVDQ